MAELVKDPKTGNYRAKIHAFGTARDRWVDLETDSLTKARRRLADEQLNETIKAAFRTWDTHRKPHDRFVSNVRQAADADPRIKKVLDELIDLYSSYRTAKEARQALSKELQYRRQKVWAAKRALKAARDAVIRYENNGQNIWENKRLTAKIIVVKERLLKYVFESAARHIKTADQIRAELEKDLSEDGER